MTWQKLLGVVALMFLGLFLLGVALKQFFLIGENGGEAAFIALVAVALGFACFMPAAKLGAKLINARLHEAQ